MFERVVVGIDGGAASNAALSCAARLAPGSACPLHGVHVLTPEVELIRDLPPFGLTSWRTKVGHAVDEVWMEAARVAGRSAEGTVVDAHQIADGLIHAAERLEASVIVIGAPSANSALGRRLSGSAAVDLINASRVPVLVVPEEKPA
jgi:nucleotide-binding universal stress UspA family protein